MGLTGWFVTEHAAHPEGIYVVSFVLDVGGKIQSAFLPFFHQLPIPGRWQPCRTVGRNPVVALVAQWIERPSPERKATSPILVEGTHENSANHNARSPSSLLSQTVAPRTARASRGNALVAQRIERRFPKPGAAGPTPAMGTMPC